ncbi:MAG: hypothetical protein HY000_13270, partial [Planctomycetes bacterium]|nr:hypothetical protein [Planctomycetota bacterium]
AVPIQYTFTIDNTGGEDLTLDVPSLQLPTGFSLVVAFEATVAPFASTEFVVQLDAAQAGVYAGEVSFGNNDADEDPYDFWISGNVVSAPFLTLDLDANDSSGMVGSDYYAEWTLGQGAVSAADPVDALVDSESPTLESLTVTITDLANAGQEWLDANTAGTAIAKAYNPETGVLTLSGADAVANYQQVLRTVSYDDTAPVPTGPDRTLLFTASDGLNYATAYAYLLLVVPEENLPDVIKVEFVKSDDVNRQGIADADRYGKLDPNTNPDGDVNNDGNPDMVRFALVEPAFEGGDRFFPDALFANPKVGRNIVRVRAYVDNMQENDVVVFRPFDVDDPSTHTQIDTNGAAGGDNRGRLAGVTGDSIHKPAQSQSPGSTQRPNPKAPNGRLRSVNWGGNSDVVGAWANDGSMVEARVKKLRDAAGNVVTDVAGNPILVAEVDLLTAFAPGDNFRVYAVPDRLREQLKAKNDVPTNGNDPHGTPQLSIWRYLHVEDDTRSGPYALMTAATVNRQQNRFADGYLEPEYNDINGINGINKPLPAPATRPLRLNRDGTQVDKDDAKPVIQQIQSLQIEQDTYWVVVVTDLWPISPHPNIFGATLSDFEASVVFTQTIAAGVPAAQVADAANKTAVHEVGHQILHSFRHTGTADHIAQYSNAPPEVKANDAMWEDYINIMNAAAIQVPMNNPTNNPAIGAIDRFYFTPSHIVRIRMNTKSPGK